jgi:hypothetical protein
VAGAIVVEENLVDDYSATGRQHLEAFARQKAAAHGRPVMEEHRVEMPDGSGERSAPHASDVRGDAIGQFRLLSGIA